MKSLNLQALILCFLATSFIGLQTIAQCTNTPTSLSSTAISTTSASVTWSSSGASNWQVQYGLYGFTLGSGTIVNTSSSNPTISSLTTNIVYQFYVRNDCGGGSYSAWAGPMTMSAVLTPCDNFDAYTTGLIDPQSTLFEGWQGSGGDGLVSTEYANSGTKSVKVHTTGSNGFVDIVALPGTYSSGVHNVQFDFFLPTNYGGYYNILHNYVGTGTNVWAIEVYLNSNGTTDVQEGTNGTGTIGSYGFNTNAWNTIEHIINLDEDTAFIKVNGNYTDVGWQFSLGSTNFGDQFNAVNLYSTAPASQTPLTYYDNFCVTDAPVDDIGITGFYYATPICGDSVYPVTVILQNFAENAQTGFDIEAAISGTSSGSISFTYNDILQPGMADTVIIGTFNNLNGGTYNIAVNTDLNGDTDNSNDGISATGIVVLPGVALNLGPDVEYCSSENYSQTLTATNANATYLWSTGSTSSTINIDTAGTYWGQVSNTSGCSKSDTLHVAELQGPQVNLGEDVSYCGNDLFSLFLNGTSGMVSYQWSTGGTSQFELIDTAGAFSVMVENAIGCIDYDTIVVTELVPPVIPLSDMEACAGDTLVLDAGNAGSMFQWSLGGQTTQTIEVTLENSYSVTVTDTSGCSNSDTIYATFNIIPFVILGQDTVILPGQSVTLDAGNAGATYLWSTGATTQTIVVNQSNTYAVTVTNAFGCEGYDQIDVDVNVGLSESTKGAFFVFPNPVTDVATIEVSLGSGSSVEVELFDLSGKIVKASRHTNIAGIQRISVDMSEIDAGVYFIRVSRGDSESSIVRVIKANP